MADQAVIDPTGFQAILTEQTWAEHIATRHPEVTRFRDRVVETIKGPDAIHVGKQDPRCRIYSKRYVDTPGVGKELTLLVYVRSESGRVATAHFMVRTFRRLGREIWPSK